ncbi:hypothetical protein [Rhizobium yanglingense]
MIAGAIYGGMVALVTFVEPQPRDVTIRIPSETDQPAGNGRDRHRRRSDPA